MKHALRKYLNNRGSALFMVLSLMTALMVLVMAMYFSVVSSREVQYKVFYTEQSYRSAISLSDALISGLNDNKWTSTGSKTMTAAIDALAVGESMSTKGNNFAAFLGTGAADADQLGAYTVNITRLEDEDSAKLYDMAVTVSVGGVVDTIHTFLRVSNAEYDTEGPDQTFTSTGYSPNDVYIETGLYQTDMFFDNEYTIIGGYGGGALKFKRNLSCGGSLRLANHNTGDAEEPVTWAVRNHFYMDTNSTFSLGTDSERGLLMVGGNMYISNAAGLPTDCDIYILGDLHIMPNQSFSSSSNVRLFVNGTIYLEQLADWCNLPTDSSGNAAYYCSNVINNSGSTGRSFVIQKWDEGDEAKNIMSVSEMAKKLDNATKSQTFYKWEINSTDDTKPDFISELDTRSDTSGNRKTIVFNNDWQDVDGIPARTQTVVLDWDNTKEIPNYFGVGKPLKYTAHVIEDVKFVNNGNQDTQFTIVIDTGDDPANQHIIKVLPNCDFDDDGTNETFCWHPKVEWASDIDESSGCQLTILIRGKGSVVVDIPKNCTYQEAQEQWIMHESWYYLLGGKVGTNASGSTKFDGASLRNNEAVTATVVNFIHRDCGEDCSLCNYVVETDPTKITDCPMKFDNGEDCDGKVQSIYCAEHDYKYTYCDVCGYEPEYKELPDGTKKYYGLCVNRVDRTAVRNAMSSLGAAEKANMYRGLGDDGLPNTQDDIVYPTVNYFLVSSDESASIKISGANDPMDDDKFINIGRNACFGFIYAPYMTYKAYNNGVLAGAAGQRLRFCGGMIVSDYVLDDDFGTVNCMPEYLPTHLMSNENAKNILQSTTGKEWKISLAGY